MKLSDTISMQYLGELRSLCQKRCHGRDRVVFDIPSGCNMKKGMRIYLGIFSLQNAISYQSKSLWCSPSTEIRSTFVAIADSATLERMATHTEMTCMYNRSISAVH